MHLAKPLSWPQTSEAHRIPKACTRHALRQIVYDDSDEVDYTNRVPEIVTFQMKRDGLPPLLADSDEVGYTIRVVDFV